MAITGLGIAAIVLLVIGPIVISASLVYYIAYEPNVTMWVVLSVGLLIGIIGVVLGIVDSLPKKTTPEMEEALE